MSNTLLSIESAFLELPQVKDALNISEIKRAKRNVANAQKRKFEHTMTLASLVKNAVDWFDSEEGKELFREEGIEWSKADFGLKVFGWQKSFFYKVIKAGNMDERIVDAFNRKCDELGEDAQRSLAGLLKFAQGIDLSSIEMPEDATADEIAEAEAEAIEEAEIEQRDERIECRYSFSFKNPEGRGVSIRVNADGSVVSQNSPEEMAQAVADFLQSIGVNRTQQLMRDGQ